MKENMTFFTLFLVFLTTLCFGQEAPLWLRYPAISPDGKQIVFAYKGDLYRMQTKDSIAYPLTIQQGRDILPVWSPNGDVIAFASKRYGNYDIFTIPVQGGQEKRITYHSASDYPSDFTPDGKRVIFSSARLDAPHNQQFPSGVLPELYGVPLHGGQISQLLTTPAEKATFNSDGSHLIFHNRKGYENPWRKHHTSSVTRDIWMYDLKNDNYQQISSYSGEERNPIFAPGDSTIYYLSEQNGDFNIFKKNINGEQTTQITHFEKHPVRFLSISHTGILCFSWNGEIYTLKEGEDPKKVKVQIGIGQQFTDRDIKTVKDKATQFALSPNGKEVAFIHRGEVFVASVAKGTTRRITNTPQQERSVSFSPDGKTLLYAGERNGSWNIYQTKIVREEEPYFFIATTLEEEAVVNSEKEEFQPAYSPNGKEIAYLEERTRLMVFNLESKKSREILQGTYNYSYSDGDQHYKWSPDSKWFLVNYLPYQSWNDQIGLISASGSEEPINLTKSGYANAMPEWGMQGKMMYWYSDRDGQTNHGSWGGEGDIYGMFFTQKTYNRFSLNEEEFALLEEKEKKETDEKEDKKDKKDKKEKDKSKEKKKIEPISIELDGIENRKEKLTIHSSDLGGAYLKDDGSKLYYMAKFEKGYDLWETELRTKKTKKLVALGAKSVGHLQTDEDEKNLFLLADGHILKIDLAKGEKEQIGFNGKMEVWADAERDYLFHHVWRQVKKKFYKKDLHGVDWAFYREAYARFLPHINNNEDLAELLSEMLGELNASHTGAYYRGKKENPDATASLGLYLENNEKTTGLTVVEVLEQGPADLSASKIRAGHILEKIDGQSISDTINYYSLLNQKAGQPTLLQLYDPENESRYEEVIKPISLAKESELRYQRWVKHSRLLVDSLSDGQFGYVHVKGMNDESYRDVYEEVLGRNADKKALIVDTRFNGGGWLHDDLVTFLSGEKYMTFMPRGQKLGTEPQFKWQRPSAVVMSEGNYSDAHMFPYAYKELEIGKLVGMPVPGTGTAVWWENLHTGDLVFGIPQVGMLTEDGKFLENTQLEPDIKVANHPDEVSQGRDQQLEAAVEALNQQIKK